MKKFTVLSLFAGAGGLDLGFERQGFHTVWANDIDKDACETYKLWSRATVVSGDIGKVDFSTLPRTDIILGGFPCQGFSLAGPRKIDDHRNKLYKHFVEILNQIQPMAFVAENVKGILTLGQGKIIEAIINDFSSKGYLVKFKLVNASDYEVPQDRMRVVMVGIRKDLNLNFTFPEPSNKRVTIKDAIQFIPEPNEDDVCLAPFSSRYMSRNRKRHWNDVSFTITAMAKQCPLHPSSPDMKNVDKDKWLFGEGKTRRFSWQEAAAIQTFPKNFKFVGDLTSKYKQIGNAVPVKLAEQIASRLRETLKDLK